eukprot:g2783.t1
MDKIFERVASKRALKGAKKKPKKANSKSKKAKRAATETPLQTPLPTLVRRWWRGAKIPPDRPAPVRNPGRGLFSFVPTASVDTVGEY